MRIAITINSSWNIYNFRSGLIEALLKGGNEVLAVAPRDNFSQKLIDMGCQYIPVKIDNTGGNPVRDYMLYRQLKSVYREYRPNIVLQYTVKPNIYGTLAAHSLKIPVINNVSGLGTVFLTKGIASTVAKWLYQVSFRKAHLVLFQNPDDQKDFLSQVNLPDLNTDLLPGSGINIKRFESKPLSNGSKFIFLMIARLIADKGVLEYAQAAKQIKAKYPEVECRLLGQIDEQHARGISASTIDLWHREGTINYLGTSEDVRIEIAQADCVVLPSYREGTPKTLLEAAAMSRPIVTTDVPGCREVVEHGVNGFLCEARNVKDLAEKMLELRQLPLSRLGKMGKNGRKLIEEVFNEDIVIRRYLYHISKILDKNQLS